MELLAAIVGLESLTEACHVTLTTDSQYVKQGINQWIHNWRKNGWKTSAKKPVKKRRPLATTLIKPYKIIHWTGAG